MTISMPRALAATAVLAVLLSGCSDDNAESPDGNAPTDFLGQTVSPDGEDGLPEDYPRESAPLLLSQSTSSEGDGKAGYSVTTTFSSAETVDVLAQAVALLTDAGWEVTSPASEGAEAQRLATTLGMGEDGVIIIQAVRSEDDVNLTYLVRPPTA